MGSYTARRIVARLQPCRIRINIVLVMLASAHDRTVALPPERGSDERQPLSSLHNLALLDQLLSHLHTAHESHIERTAGPGGCVVKVRLSR
jgi:hypothetical protein